MRARAAYLALFLLACSSDDSSPPDLPPGAPTFAGVAAVAPAGEGLLRISWRPGNDAETGPASLRYRVYISVHGGGALENTPLLTTEQNATSVYVKVDPASARHFVTVRAVDPDGHEDVNRIEKSAQPALDTTPPTFPNGLKTLDGTPDGTVKLGWDAASDDLTPPEGIRYEVYSGPDLVDYAHPITVVEGVTEVTIPNAIATGQVKRFAVRAVDASDNHDDNTVALRHQLDAPPTSPTFAGCTAVTTRGSKSVTVSWAAATDDTTPADKIVYEVWVATSPGGETLGGQPNATVTGATSVVIDKLIANTTYYAVCRARDQDGNRDGNTAEKSGKTSSDSTAPQFLGIDTMTFDEVNRTVTLTWLAATDDFTSSNKIVYALYEKRDTGIYDFEKPRVVTAANALSVDLKDLPSDTTFKWVVRARDEALNEDTNLAEQTGTTFVSYALDIAPIFAKSCAVVGCHTSALPAGGMSLSSTVAYGNIVGIAAGQKPAVKRIDPYVPDNSYILWKTQVVTQPFSGNPMPAPGTGNSLLDPEKAHLKKWVEQGALKN